MENKYFLFYFEFILLLLKFSSINLIITKNKRNLFNHFSEINLVIQGIGEKLFLYENFEPSPSKVLLNGVEDSSCNKKKCNLQGNRNNITLIFEDDIETCQYMFSGLKDIIEIDFLNFESSKVTTMKSMFYECENLEKVHFGNINTASVNSLELLFKGCSHLTSIDLSKFDTSKVENMKKMFCDCTNLNIINFGNIDTSSVSDMEYLFSGCSSIEYLNLSSFSSRQLTTMKFMFNDCNSLKCLNLKLFKFGDSLEYGSALKNVPQDTKYCIEDANTVTKLKIKSNCDDICFKEIKQIEFEFLDGCNFLLNNYKYHNNCYIVCPNNTYPIDNIEKKNADIVANNFSKIGLGSSNKNENILENKISTKIDDKIECYDKTPEGYYLDLNNKQYKKCFETCKFCDGKGNQTIHNCKECISNFTFLDETKFSTNCFQLCKYYSYFNELNEYLCTINFNCPEQYNKLIINKKKCIDDCKRDDTYQYEYNNNCYEKCPNNTYELENNQDNKCYANAIEGYYLNLEKKKFEKCYETCQTCEIGGNRTNNNCLQCKEKYKLYKNLMNISNCYEKCDYYYYFDELNEYHCNAT